MPSYDEIKKLPNKVLLWCGKKVIRVSFFSVRSFVCLRDHDFLCCVLKTLFYRHTQLECDEALAARVLASDMPSPCTGLYGSKLIN